MVVLRRKAMLGVMGRSLWGTFYLARMSGLTTVTPIYKPDFGRRSERHKWLSTCQGFCPELAS